MGETNRSDDTPIIFLKPDENGRTIIPKSGSMTRPFRYVWPDGRVEYESLPLFNCLYKLGEDGVEKYFPRSESYRWNDPALNSMAWAHSWGDLMTTVAPCSLRYGHLPFWFPDDDLNGRKLTLTAQVDRFLYLLENVISLPEDHTKIDPKILIAGLIELREHFDEDNVHDWDDENNWPAI
jgi:hypothetical protein